MFSEIYTVPSNLAFQIPWEGRDLEYDLQLYTLGDGHEEFVVFNPERGLNLSVIKYAKHIPNTRKCIVWTYDGKWIAKLFKDGWYPYHGYETVELKKPTFIWKKNPDLDRSMTFEESLYSNYKPDDWEEHRKLVWYIDKRFNPLDDEVWAFSCEPAEGKQLGTKNMGYVMPAVRVEINEHLVEEFGIDIDVDSCCPPFWELSNECVYELDPVHQTDKQLWIIKFSPSWRKSKGWKWIGTISPEVKIVYNPDLPKIDYKEIDYNIPYHDLKFEHVWMLDPQYSVNATEPIWAFKLIATNDPIGTKIIGIAEPQPTIVYNPDLPKINYKEIDYNIPYHDLKFEHVWMLDPRYSSNATEPIWAFKLMATTDPIGTKIIGTAEPQPTIEINKDLELPINFLNNFIVQHHDFAYQHVWVATEEDEKIWIAKLSYTNEPIGIKVLEITDEITPDVLDVIFISYGEPNAEKNWKRVKEKAPWAQRVDNVDGILEAHKLAAKKSRTDMFYVVDGDAYLFKKWKFDFVPSIFDRDCTYIWSAKNPLVDLTYGHGGVKLFSKSKLLKLKKWRTLDMTTSISEKIKVTSEISNWTEFNTDSFSTWRTAFRECVKLSVNMYRYPDNPEHKLRLDKWKSVDVNETFGKYAKDACEAATEFVGKNIDDHLMLMNINNRSWLKDTFEKTYKVKINND